MNIAAVILTLMLAAQTPADTIAWKTGSPVDFSMRSLPTQPLEEQPPKRFNIGSAAANSRKDLLQFALEYYFEGIEVSEKRRDRLLFIIDSVITLQSKTSASGWSMSDRRQMQRKKLAEYQAALRAFLENDADRARFDANLKKLGYK